MLDNIFARSITGCAIFVKCEAKGYPVTYVEGETGHNWTAWRDRLADAFIALWK